MAEVLDWVRDLDDKDNEAAIDVELQLEADGQYDERFLSFEDE